MSKYNFLKQKIGSDSTFFPRYIGQRKMDQILLKSRFARRKITFYILYEFDYMPYPVRDRRLGISTEERKIPCSK
jgi:hypothetical protein